MKISKKEYKNYRNKIEEILNNKDNEVVGEFTFYYSKKQEGIIMTHLINEIVSKTIKIRKVIMSMILHFLSGIDNKYIKETNLGDLK